MLEGKWEENRVLKKMLSSPHRKIEMSKNKTKALKKELRELENQRKNDEKREMNKKIRKNDLSRNDPWLKLP